MAALQSGGWRAALGAGARAGLLGLCMVCLPSAAWAERWVGKVVGVADGDTVTLIKDLKVKGSSTTLKVGSKIKGIRLVSGDHEVDCKTEAGNILLKACFLKKA